MKITNKNTKRSQISDYQDFSHYFLSQSKELLQNRSTSYNNETQLLEQTQNEQKVHQVKEPLQFYTSSSQVLDNSLLGDLCEQLEITISQSKIEQSGQSERENEKVKQLYNICKNLIGTLKNLEHKVQKIENSGSCSRQMNLKHKESSPIDLYNKESQSILTYSSMNSSQQCKCSLKCLQDKEINHKIFQSYQQQKAKNNFYLDQLHQTKQNNIRLEACIEELKKQIKKVEGQNIKLKQLLKQYQQFNKRYETENRLLEKQMNSAIYDKDAKIKSDKNLRYLQTNNDQFCRRIENKYYQNEQNYEGSSKMIKNLSENISKISKVSNKLAEFGKQNQKQAFQKKIRQEQMVNFFKSTPLTPNPIINKQLRENNFKFAQQTDQKYSISNHQKITNQIRQSLEKDSQKTEPKQKKNILFLTFQQCKSASPKFQKTDGNVSQNRIIGLRKKISVESEVGNKYPFKELMQNRQNTHLLQNIETMTSLPEGLGINKGYIFSMDKSIYNSPNKHFQLINDLRYEGSLHKRL